MCEPDRRRLGGVFLGLGGWLFLLLLTRRLGPSLTARFALLAAQQAMFIAIGLFCVRRKILSFPGLKTFAKGILSGVGLYAANAVLGSLTLQIFARLLGSETTLRLLAAERAALEPFLNGESPLLAAGMGGLMLIVGGAPLSEELFFGGALFLIN